MFRSRGKLLGLLFHSMDLCATAGLRRGAALLRSISKIVDCNV